MNEEKAAQPLDAWLAAQFPLEDERRDYMRQHFIPDVPATLDHFLAFYDARRALMRDKLREVVGLPTGAPTGGSTAA